MRPILVMQILILAADVPSTPTALAQADEFKLKDLPSFYFGGGKYRVDPYLAAASKLQKAGKDKAIDALRKHGGFDSAVVLGRMLFTGKPKKQFHRAGIGGPVCLGGTKAEDWVLEPIELVDGIPFLIVRGYNLGGQPEVMFLDRWVKECDWGTTQFKPRSAAEKKKALAKLLASPKWKRPLDKGEKAFLSAQIK